MEADSTMLTPFHNRHRAAVRGFTLIEILAAMTILVLLVLMLTKVYTEGSNAWKTGTRNATRNMLARSVMDFMAKELSMATFEFGNDPKKNYLSMAYFADTTTGNFGLDGADEIFFVKLNKRPDAGGDEGEQRSAELIRYYVANLSGLTNAPDYAQYRFALWRDDQNPTTTKVNNDYYPLYLDDTYGLYWMGKSVAQLPTKPRRPGSILVDDVRTFEIFAYLDEEGASSFGWQSFGPDKLAFLDIYLETFDERDAAQAALLADSMGDDDPTVVAFVERAVKRNYRRVYLYNQQGYQGNW